MRKNDIVVDSRFFVPQNIVDIRYKEEEDNFWVPSQESIEIQVGETAASPTGDSAGLPTPDVTFEIIDQIIKIAPDGTQTVDVIIELPDVSGADYEMRISRVV